MYLFQTCALWHLMGQINVLERLKTLEIQILKTVQMLHSSMQTVCMTQSLYFAKQFSLSCLEHLLGGLEDK